MTFEQWWDKETEAVGRKGAGRNGVVYQIAKRAWVAAERKEREACAKACEDVDLHSGDHLKNSDPRMTCAAAIRAR